MRASRPTAPSGVTSKGLTSTSAISVCAAAKRESAAAARAAARRSTGGRPRPPANSCAPRNESRSRSAVFSSSGASAVCTSLKSRVDAAEADERQRPEALVAPTADDDLHPLAQRRHALQGEAVLAEPRRELRIGGPEPALVGDVEHHPTLVGLVQPPQRFEHERVAETARRHDGPFEALDEARLREWDARLLQHAPRRPVVAVPDATVRLGRVGQLGHAGGLGGRGLRESGKHAHPETARYTGTPSSRRALAAGELG